MTGNMPSVTGFKVWRTARPRRASRDSIDAHVRTGHFSVLGPMEPHPNPVLERFRKIVRRAFVWYKMSLKLRTLRDMFADIQLDPDRIKPIRVLGKGGFGMVHLVEYLRLSGETDLVAIKASASPRQTACPRNPTCLPQAPFLDQRVWTTRPRRSSHNRHLSLPPLRLSPTPSSHLTH